MDFTICPLTSQYTSVKKTRDLLVYNPDNVITTKCNNVEALSDGFDIIMQKKDVVRTQSLLSMDGYTGETWDYTDDTKSIMS